MLVESNTISDTKTSEFSMPGQKCCVWSNTQALDDKASFHRFPKEIGRRTLWMDVFGLQEKDIKPSCRVCSRHFPDGDSESTV